MQLSKHTVNSEKQPAVAYHIPLAENWLELFFCYFCIFTSCKHFQCTDFRSFFIFMWKTCLHCSYFMNVYISILVEKLNIFWTFFIFLHLRMFYVEIYQTNHLLWEIESIRRDAKILRLYFRNFHDGGNNRKRKWFSYISLRFYPPTDRSNNNSKIKTHTYISNRKFNSKYLNVSKFRK